MTPARSKRIKYLGLVLGALLAGAVFVACDTIGNDRQNGPPTDPTPADTIPQQGAMTITPSSATLTITGGNGGGRFFIFRLTGGKPPFVWGNSWPEMGQVIPIDEFGQGYFTAVKYVVRNFRGTGNDTISVRDDTGAIASAQFTKTIVDATAPPRRRRRPSFPRPPRSPAAAAST